MRKWQISAVAAMLLLAGCSADKTAQEDTATKTSDNATEQKSETDTKKDSETVVPKKEEEEKSTLEDGTKVAPDSAIKKEHATKTVDKATLADKALFDAELPTKNEMLHLYIVPKNTDGFRELTEDTSYGFAGDAIYEGELEFYLASELNHDAVLQPQNKKSYVVNRSERAFAVHTLADDNAFLTYTIAAENTKKETHIWSVIDGSLQALNVQGDTALVASSDIHFFEGYAQYFNYITTGSEGWHFITLKYNAATKSFESYREKSYMGEQASEGEQFTEQWYADESFHLPVK